MGRFFDELKTLGLYDNSLIIITADHGEAFYERGHWQHSQTLYDEIVRIPLIAKWPDQGPRGRVGALASQIDIFPSILAVAGVEPPTTEAMNLWELVNGNGRESEGRLVISEVTWRSPKETSMKVSFRTKASKFMATLSGPVGDDLGVSELLEEELYNLQTDPRERENLLVEASADGAGFRARIRSFLDTARAVRTTRQGQQVELDAELIERLRSLGYVDH